MALSYCNTKVENLTDLLKMSKSDGLNVGAIGVETSSNQFGTDGRPLQLHETLLEQKVGQSSWKIINSWIDQL